IVRHIKVKSESSPYDGNLVYWSTRMGKNPEMPSKVSKLLKKQKGKCTHCGLFFRENDVMEIDHRIPKSQDGKDSYDNWQLLHRHCHDTKTAIDSSLGNQSGCNSAKPKPTRKLEKVDDKWVMRYA
ncbi:HNH endonuclease signature motif containing protein, partial [Microcoleus sp. D3_18_C4]|uniref:HNH endonuclease signature motif containing protein n=1 Tax=Microcoleus sp. D3_18_C4 TaxID=3055335 RepID=UPI002FD07024